MELDVLAVEGGVVLASDELADLRRLIGQEHGLVVALAGDLALQLAAGDGGDEGLVVDEMHQQPAVGLKLIGEEDIGGRTAGILLAGAGRLQIDDVALADIADEAFVVIGLAGAVLLMIDGIDLDHALAAVEDMQEQPSVLPIRLP